MGGWVDEGTKSASQFTSLPSTHFASHFITQSVTRTVTLPASQSVKQPTSQSVNQLVSQSARALPSLCARDSKVTHLEAYLACLSPVCQVSSHLSFSTSLTHYLHLSLIWRRVSLHYFTPHQRNIGGEKILVRNIFFCSITCSLLRPVAPRPDPSYPPPPILSLPRLRSVRTDEIKFSFQKDPFMSAVPLTNVSWQSWLNIFPRPTQFSSQQFYISYFWPHSQNLYFYLLVQYLRLFIYLFTFRKPFLSLFFSSFSCIPDAQSSTRENDYISGCFQLAFTLASSRPSPPPPALASYAASHSLTEAWRRNALNNPHQSRRKPFRFTSSPWTIDHAALRLLRRPEYFVRRAGGERIRTWAEEELLQNVGGGELERG